jgi:hypothetical protein
MLCNSCFTDWQVAAPPMGGDGEIIIHLDHYYDWTPQPDSSASRSISLSGRRTHQRQRRDDEGWKRRRSVSPAARVHAPCLEQHRFISPGGHASMCRARSRLAALPCCQTWQLSSCKNQHRMQDLLLAIFAAPCGDGHQGSSFPSREEQDPMILEAVCAPVSRSDARPLPALLRDACCGLPAICACFK